MSEAISDVANQIGVPVFIDRRKVAEEGISLDAPTTFHHQEMTARSALAILLKPRQLAWIVKNELLFITTSASVADSMVTRVYDVSDIATRFRDERGNTLYDLTSLMNAITTTIEPDSDWGNGPGVIMPYRSGGIVALTFPQAIKVHEAVARFLTELRDLRLASGASIDPQEYLSPNGGLRRTRPSPDPRRDALVRGNNQFALELFSKLARDTNGNLLVSPYCISGAVALAYAGARGQTAREIGEAMHYIVRQEDLPAAFRSLQPGFFLWGPDARLKMTRQFWGQQGIEYRDGFQRTLHDFYQSGILPLDFSDPARAAQAINDWTVARTGGSILRLANPADFTAGTRFVVASAVRFDGKWSKPFDSQSTRLVRFASPHGEIDVAQMHLTVDNCRYAVVDGIQILEKTYGNQDVSMVVLLPSVNPTGLADVEAALHENNLAKWLAAEDSHQVELFLPRFKLESAFNLRRELEACGILAAFELGKADFSGISKAQQLALSGVIHKAFVQVDEQGPRPAPGMSGFGNGRAKTDSPLPVFRADHPFLFLIRDTQTGSIVFIGRVVRPEPPDPAQLPID